MGIILKGDGNIDIGIEAIETIEVSVDTPKDTDAKTTDMGATIRISGKILTVLDDATEGTKELALWSMVPAEKTECYRKLNIKVNSAGTIVRDYTIPNAFIVDYQENYGDTEGVGTFILVVKQKKDKLKSIEINGGYAM